MRLQRLTGLERKKIEDEYLEVIKKIEHLQGDPGEPGDADGHHQGGARRAEGEVRRRAAHGDRGRGGRGLRRRGPDRRGGHGDHDLPRRLHQADAGDPLPQAAPRAARAWSGWRPRKRTSSSTCSSPRPTTTSSSSPTPASATGRRSTSCPRPAGTPRARRSPICWIWPRRSGSPPSSRPRTSRRTATS